jgi:hypothetical protein
MPKVQSVEYNKVTRAGADTRIRESVGGIAGYRSLSGHFSSPLYRKHYEWVLNSRGTIAIRETPYGGRFNAVSRASHVHSSVNPMVADLLTQDKGSRLLRITLYDLESKCRIIGTDRLGVGRLRERGVPERRLHL